MSDTDRPLALVTGGAGFIGSHLARMLLAEGEYRVRVLDSLTYAGNLENLADIAEDPGYQFVRADITVPEQVEQAFEGGPDVVLHLAAESHVDRSLEDSGAFLRTNVEGTRVLLEAARKVGVRRFVQVSTDEVYGSLGPTGAFREDSPLAPSSPYSASKAAADLLAAAYHHTFGLEVCITRCSNNYGPNQFPEKLIPLMIANAMGDRELPVYGDGQQVRDWIYVTDHCRGILDVLEKGRPGRVYNFGGEAEMPNLEVVRLILGLLGKPESLVRYVKDRPGHDRRYAMDIARVRDELGWEPAVTFEEGMRRTVDWYRDNQTWLEHIRQGDYLGYYDRMYADRLQSANAGG